VLSPVGKRLQQGSCRQVEKSGLDASTTASLILQPGLMLWIQKLFSIVISNQTFRLREKHESFHKCVQQSLWPIAMPSVFQNQKHIHPRNAYPLIFFSTVLLLIYLNLLHSTSSTHLINLLNLLLSTSSTHLINLLNLLHSTSSTHLFNLLNLLHSTSSTHLINLLNLLHSTFFIQPSFPISSVSSSTFSFSGKSFPTSKAFCRVSRAISCWPCS